MQERCDSGCLCGREYDDARQTEKLDRENQRQARLAQADELKRARRIEREKQRQAKRQKSEIMARLAESMSQRATEQTPRSHDTAYGSAYSTVHHDWIKGRPSPAPRSIYQGVFDDSGRRVALVARDNNDAANELAKRCGGYVQRVKY
jgi:hypothetical protein